MRLKTLFGLLVFVACACLLSFLLIHPGWRLEDVARRSDCTLCGPTKTSVTAKQVQAPSSTQAVRTEHPQAVLADGVAGDVLAGFDAWSQKYLQATADERAAIIEEGARLAKARRPIFKQLIQSDPRRALQEAVRPLVRQTLPAEILAELEKPVEDRGVLRVYQAGPESVANGESSQLRYVETQRGETYQAYVYGRRAASVAWVANLSANGVAMDGQMALDERPLRVMEPGEILPADMPRVAVCPVSKKNLPMPPPEQPIQPETPAIIANGEVVYLCDGSHTTVYEQMLIQGESGTGGAQSFTGILPASATPSVGVVKVLYIPVVFPDQNEVPITEAGAQSVLAQSAAFYQTMSFGRLTLVGTVTPPVRMPKSRAWYVGKDTTSGFIKEVDGLGLEMSHAKEEARKLGYDWQDYHATVARANGGARSPTSYGGGGNVWMRTDSVNTTAHEVGHAFGLAHANFWETNGASTIGPGGNVEYGDDYDNMGPSAAVPNGHYNVQAKNQVKWMPDEFAPSILSSGTYRIYAMDQPKLDPGKLYGVRIRKDANRTYWGEFRLLGGNNWTNNGLLWGWKWPGNSGDNIQLLDTTPGSVNLKSDAGITVGRTFSDTETGIHVTTLAVNTNTTPQSLDVVVNLGTFPGNNAPTLTLTPATPVVPTSTNVTFTATANDVDGDTLAYSWQWHDNLISGSGSTATRSFSTAGIYTLSCVVTDMKGGIAVRNSVITVGNGNTRYTIAGRITRAGSGIPNITVGTGGANGTLTDSDGYYTISNLAAGNYSVIAEEHGLVFNNQFNNSITVGPSFSGADFTVEDLPAISITAKTPVAIEAGASGAFRISRTGPIGQAKDVYVFTVQGTATKGTVSTNDYYFTPDYVSASPFQSFTIPANSAFLDVVVAARNDASSEGDESVTLVLAADTSYVLGAQNTATLSIQDVNTALPRVSLTIDRAQTIENSGSPLVVTATRTGATTAALAVNYTVASTSTATGGSDYSALTGTVTIPIGLAAATFNLTPLDDAESELTETITVAIASGASFIADVAASTLTARIVDDDAQTISVTAADNAAQEIDRTAVGAVPNPGTFLVTRTGNTTAAVTVYYSVAGVALHGADYDVLLGSVVIPAGQTQAAVTIMPKMDNFAEGSETVILALGAAFGYYQIGSSGTATINITDNVADKPLLEVTAYSAIAAEGGTNGTFRITAKGGAAGNLTVNYTVSGTASNGTDYTALSGSTTLVLTGGTVTGNVTITVTNDPDLEELENVIITLTPDANYALWAPMASATMLLRDNDQNTVFVDGQIGTGGNDFVAEGSTATTCKFFVSRVGGSLASALVVNYTLGGTATAGTDYTNVNLTGSVTIPANSAGVDITFNTIVDALGEGAETILFQLTAGAYARGPDAKLYITDDDANTQSVAFGSPGSAGAESVTSVTIPVTLNAPASTPVSVEYNLEAGPRTTSYLYGTWLRIVRTGNSYVTSTSPDGVTWTVQSSTRTITMSSASYLAGIFVASGSSGTPASAIIDNVSITDLTSGSPGAVVSAEIGTVSPLGGSQESGGVYQVTSTGSDISTATTDNCRFVYFPITASANCTLIARVVSLGGPSAMKAGVMIRETTANNALRMAFHVNTGTLSQSYRTTTAGSGTNATGTATTYSKPRWLRLNRTGNVFTASISPDGVTFTPVGGGVNVGLSAQLLVGMAVSSRSDGTLTQATFDNVNLSPAASVPFQDRTVGFVDAQGWTTESGGIYTVTASGAGIMNSVSSLEDEGHFLSLPVTGDFTVTTRLTGLSTATAQAGLLVRESVNYRARALSFCLTGLTATNSTAEWRGRYSATESGEGSGIDYALPPGVLNFAIGEQTKDITLNVTNDNVIESAEFVNILLKNPSGAIIAGGSSSHTYTILDDDVVSALPVISFASTTSSGLENVTPVQIPIVLSEPAGSDVSVDFTLAAGTATDGSDFTSATGTLTFTAGQTLAYVPMTLLDDSIVETAETITLTLSAPVSGIIGTSSIHTFTITDDDTAVVSIIASDATATEGGDTGVFTFTRTGSTTSALTVNFVVTGTAVSATDYTAFSPTTSIVIPIGQSSAVLTLTTAQNTTPEVNETVIVTLGTGSGYTVGTPNAGTVTIMDDDVNTITLTTSDATATEAAGNGGEFTLTRTGPTTAALTVTLSFSGTATSGSDYTAITTTRTFNVGISSITVPVSTLTDATIEGAEIITASIASSTGYIIGSPNLAGVTIVDDDLPPSVFISSPGSKSTLINAANGLVLSAVGTDDGLPAPLTYAWSKTFGPGNIVFANAASASTTATFSAVGVYGIRITVSDGTYTATDDIFVQSGGFNYATWITQDQGPPATRGIAGDSGGTFTLIGSGTGYTGTNDSGHMLFRQLFTAAGDATIIARVTGLTGPATRLAGLTLRDTSWKGAKRVTLALSGSGSLVMNDRTTANVAGTATTPATGLAAPLWLKLDRVGGTLTASHAPDVAGVPGAWVSDGTSTFTSGNNLIVGMIVSTGIATSATATATFDNVSVTPAIAGTALHSENIGNYTSAGSSSENAGTITIASTGTYDGSGGHFRYQQIWGDCILTARLTSHSGSSRGAQSGVGLRDTTDNAAHAFYGNTTVDGYQVHWRSNFNGNSGALQSNGTGYIRLIRKGNTVNAYKAPAIAGPWTLNSGNLPVVLTGPLLVGLVVDGGGSIAATGIFTNLSITPLNTAPVVDAGTMLASLPPFNLDGTVTDDGQPAQPGSVSKSWTQLAGPGLAAFANPATEDTLATLSMSGAHTFRLSADDGDAVIFDDLTFTGYLSAFAKWLDQNGVGDENNTLAEADADMDNDGLANLFEYAVGTNGIIAGSNPQVVALAPVSSSQYLRISIPKNPAATDVTFTVEATSDLSNPLSWNSAGLIIETNNSTQFIVRDNVAAGPGVQRFMRIRVERP
jgi:regulation of enolase protein 1 (concanavalin A-like superfamily)/plastocyanin